MVKKIEDIYDLKDALQEHLTIELSKGHEYGARNPVLRVTIKFKGDEICSDFVSLGS